MLSKEELQFINSIKNKIKTYSIPVTFEECLKHALNKFIITQYNNGTTELVDPGIEHFLCKSSAYYFLKNYCVIDLPGHGVIPFDLYYFQSEVLKKIEDLKKIVFLKTRQCGISTVFSLYCFWRGNFFESESIDVISIKQSKAQTFVNKMNATIDRLPPFLKTPITTRNQSQIKWKNGSSILSESASDKAGRGDTLSLLIMDECAHYLSDRLTRGIVGASSPTLTRTGGKAVLISTPNGISGPGSYYHEQVEQLQIDGNSDTEMLVEIGWFEVPDIEGVYPQKGYNAKLDEFIKRDYFNHPEVRKEMNDYFAPISDNWKANEWLKKQYRDTGEVLFKQEILHSFMVSGNQVFTEDTLEKIKNGLKDPISENKLGNKNIPGFWIWKNPIPKHRYIIGVDVSTGTSGDYSSAEIIDVENYEQVAEYKGRMPTKNFGQLLRFLGKYYNEAFIVIECNSIGEAVFNEVYYNDNDPYLNVYKKEKTKDGVTRMTGFETTAKSRQLIINNMVDWINIDELWDQLKIYSKRMYAEYCTWVYRDNRIDHEQGQHDDSIMSFAIALYNRNLATTAKESFLITEDCSTIDFDKDRDQHITEEEARKDLDFNEVMGTTREDFFQDTYGVDEEHYNWLLR
jgi:hypothetical protein